VLDEICSELPHGGDHESRKFVLEHLMLAARDGKTKLSELTYVGRRALVQLQSRDRHRTARKGTGSAQFSTAATRSSGTNGFAKKRRIGRLPSLTFFICRVRNDEPRRSKTAHKNFAAHRRMPLG
jgi:hypothetical protein